MLIQGGVIRKHSFRQHQFWALLRLARMTHKFGQKQENGRFFDQPHKLDFGLVTSGNV